MIYISYYNSNACGVARISRSAIDPFSVRSSATPRSYEELLETQLLDLQGPASFIVFLFILRLEKKGCISPTDTICTKSSRIRRLSHSYKTIFEIATFLDTIINRCTRLSDLSALRIVETKIVAASGQTRSAK